KQSTLKVQRRHSQSWRAFLALIAVVSLVAGTCSIANLFGASLRPALAAGSQPCDIYASGGTPCVAAHSTIRALFSAYNGNLYQVRRSSDNTTRNITPLSAGGYANAASQDSFCAGTTCVVTIIYDQSGHGNNLGYQGSGGAGGRDTPSTATSESLTVAGNKVYSLFINPGNSYWHDGSLSGMPKGSAPQGAYMITSGTHVNSGCCFDYGNSETDRKADGAGAMDAISFSTSCWFGGCTGTGPWVQADLEFGLFSGGSTTWNTNQRAFTNRYVTAMLKNNGTTQMALKGGNAQAGSLTTLYKGSLPSGYNPMKQQGAIILGSGGDCCATNTNLSQGTFYEGAIVAGYPSDATDDAVQTNIVSAGYGSNVGSTPTPTATPTQILTPTATTGAICSVQYVVTNQWAGGFGTSVTITNAGSTTLNGWTLMWTFVNGQTITDLWNGSFTQSGGKVSVTNLSYNGVLAPGSTTSFGFNGSWSGSNTNPTSFTLNGATCALV
ncbi:MAG TPA: arabinofuranosidase catalytic domain-containing protein, partial [Ktedonobacteraceae bacterium]|nr:arabinofuranosidase catalytic domain-containing protein [Ktedonobacteraceae bacterium]